jgi:alpha-tubulin suppressor-like RCC1 family protein
MNVCRWFTFCIAALLLVGASNVARAISPMISMGEKHGLALKSDGTVVAWGSDEFGQLGIGRLTYSTTPSAVLALSSVKAIGTGDNHVLAVKLDGTVWAWGQNRVYTLGDGTNIDRVNPVQVMVLTNAIAVSGGLNHSIGLRQDGTVWSWGNGDSGQLGQGSQTPWAYVPGQCKGLSGITSIAAGRMHNLALRQDGTVWAWGWNHYGQLGDGTTIDRSEPVQVQGLSDIVAISAGWWLGVALKRDGTLWEWGYATASDSSRLKPVQTLGMSNVVNVTAGTYRIVAVKSDGSTWQWYAGGNPSLMEGGTGLRQVSIGTNYSLQLKSDRSVAAAGANETGQLGDGTTTDRSSAVPVNDLTNIAAVAAGWHHSVALGTNGRVWTWGSDSNGQLGLGVRNLVQATPIQVAGLSNAVIVSSGPYHSMAVRQDGTAWSWGANDFGQLGDNSTSPHSVPGQVKGLSSVVSVAAGLNHSIALKQDGTIWTWGYNYDGAIGDGSNSYPTMPIQVPGLSGFVAIAAGTHSLGLKADGTVWSWGRNDAGQLGLGITTPMSGTSSLVNARPAQVPGLSGIKAIAAGFATSFAIGSDGRLWSWGKGWNGLLGNGDSKDSSIPVVVSGLAKVVSISMSGSYYAGHVLAIQSDGSIWGWGSLDSGLLGAGTFRNTAVPVRLRGVENITQVAAGGSSSAFLGRDGRVRIVGQNEHGQLGDGTFSQRASPVLTVNPGNTGFLSLGEQPSAQVIPSLNVPFFVTTTGYVGPTVASVKTSTQFDPSGIGKPGSIYITATVPVGSSLAQNAPVASELAGPRPSRAATAISSGFTLVQLTPTGWKTVINGQLIPYVTGVLGDQLAAQTILNETDTTNLKGAAFCVGYGTSAQDMIDNGNIRAVATIPGAATTSSCEVGGTISIGIDVLPGWNLLGNPVNQTIAVAEKFGDAAKVTSVWKWDATTSKWQVYSPAMAPTELQSYVASQGYSVLNEINPGDGYWISAKVQANLGTISGDTINLRQSSLVSGWNLVSTASPISAKDFNLSLSTTPPTAGQVPINMKSLWAWDSAMGRWYLYAPSLDAQGGSTLADYLNSQNYADFAASGKTLGNGIGIWVNRP